MDSVQNVGHNYDHTSSTKFFKLERSRGLPAWAQSLVFHIAQVLEVHHNNILYRDRQAGRETHWLTDSKEQSPSWEANSSSAIQKIPCIFRDFRLHYCHHNSLPLVNILTQMTQAHAFPLYFFNTHFNITFPSALWFSNLPLSLRFPCQKPVCTSLLPICTMWPTHLILLHFKTQIIFGEEYMSQSSSLRNFLQSPVTPSLLDPHTFLSTQFLNTFSLCPSLHVNTLHRTSQKKPFHQHHVVVHP